MMYVFVGGQENPNGISSYVNNIGRQLVQKGYRVTIFQFGSCNKEFELNGMKMIQHKTPQNSMFAIPFLFFSSLPFLVRNRKSIQIVNYQTTFLAFLPAWICRMFGIKVCFTQHSFGEDNFKHGNIVRFLISIISKISVFLCLCNFVTISNSKATEFKKKNGKECFIVPCGVNRPSSIKNDSDILRRFNIIPNKYFLIICRIDPIKNLDILIQAFNNHDNKEGYQLIIGGDYLNAYGNKLKELVANNEHIKFVGAISGDDKETLLKYCYADCLVSSSEGMPISLMEAMAYSKPCIVSNIPAIREIVDDDLGCWCNVRDVNSLARQLEYAETQPEELSRRGRNMADNVFAKYTWDVVANTYIKYCNT